MEKHGFHLIISSLELALYITSKCNLLLVDMILLYKAAKMQLFNAFIRKCWCECKMLNVQHQGVSGSGIAYKKYSVDKIPIWSDRFQHKELRLYHTDFFSLCHWIKFRM